MGTETTYRDSMEANDADVVLEAADIKESTTHQSIERPFALLEETGRNVDFP
jgi:hypothetical protein